MIQFARAVGLEVTWAPYGLLEDILPRALGLRTLGGHGDIGRFRFPRFE